jgi:hypothetical protein
MHYVQEEEINDALDLHLDSTLYCENMTSREVQFKCQKHVHIKSLYQYVNSIV